MRRVYRAWTFLLSALALVPVLAAAGDPADTSQAPTNDERFADTIARIQALPEDELKLFYLRCSRAAVRGQISSGEIALCSIGYERLLQRSFGGDFVAFLAWRRSAAPGRGPARPSPSR